MHQSARRPLPARKSLEEFDYDHARGLSGEVSGVRLEGRVVIPSVVPGDGPLPCHVDGQFEYGYPWHSEALTIGLRDMPQRGPNNEEPAAGPRHPVESTTHSKENQIVKFVGWDWASTTHDITVLDQSGHILER